MTVSGFVGFPLTVNSSLPGCPATKGRKAGGLQGFFWDRLLHGTPVTYKLAKKEGKWTVAWRHMNMYQ